MINIIFALNRRKDDTPNTERPIQCQIRYKVNGEHLRLNFATGKSCKIRYFKNQKVFHTVQFATQTNDRLKEIGDNAQRIYLAAIKDGLMPTPEKFKQQIISDTYEVKKERVLLDDFKGFVEYHQAKGTSKGSLSHITNLRTHLEQFSKKHRMILAYDSINLAFYGKFLRYLKDHKQRNGETYEENTIGNFIKKFKMFLNWAKGNGWNSYEFYKHSEFKTPEKSVGNIYLEQSELDAIDALDLRKRPNLNDTRYWFLIACETGMRYSDYKQLRKQNIKQVTNGYDFLYTPVKTSKSSKVEVTVPLSSKAVRILMRYGFEMPAPISNQKMNKGLKELAMLAGIEKIVGTHTARRTFSTLRYKEKFPVQAIMKITGHKTEKEFYKYLCIEGEENAEMFRRMNDNYHIPATGLLESKLKIA